MSSANTGRVYSVEGHGAGMLVRIGGERRGRYNAPLLTRHEAWEQFQALAADKRFHTVKVCRGCETVYAECVQAVAS